MHLRKIDFNGHFIKEINLDPEKLVNLESVLLFRNKIEIFPSKLLKFNSLRQIGLENNYIREIPKEICDSKINDLSIGRNYLTEMPECLFKKDLEYLFVNENMISDEKIKIYESLKNKKTVTIFDNQRKDFFKK